MTSPDETTHHDVEPDGTRRADGAQRSTQVVQVPVAQLAPHPDNIRAVGNVEELAASIVEFGLLQPLTVVGVAAFRAGRAPDAEDVDPDARYVVIAGHHRREACLRAGLTTVPVIVRDDLATATNAVASMIVENVQRAALTPVEEARAYDALRRHGLSQREIAKMVGVSHGQVAKRLSLLKLPETALETLQTGRVSTATAMALLKLPTLEEREIAWTDWSKRPGIDIEVVVGNHLKAGQVAAEVRRLRKAAEAAGVEVATETFIKDLFGADAWRHQLPRSTTLEQVVPEDTLAVVEGVLGHARMDLYTRTIPMDDIDQADRHHGGWSKTPGSGVNSGPGGASRGSTTLPDKDAEKLVQASRDAAVRRAHACRRLLTEGLPPEAAAEILAATLLAGDMSFAPEAVATAAAWLGEPLADADGAAGEAWLDHAMATGGRYGTCVATAVALADVEDRLSGCWPSSRLWTGEQVAHVRRLITHAGHQPSQWEQTKLAEADTAKADTAKGHIQDGDQ